jgi:hypothetical protein
MAGINNTPEHVWQEVKQRLLNAPYSMKQRGTNLREGTCPSCGKKTLWTKYAEQPGKIYCDRESKCGYEATTKELFPDLFDHRRILRDNPATPENPNASADAWLCELRGFNIETMRGWYSQQTYLYTPAEAKEEGLAGERVTSVRFPLPFPMVGNWDRFLDGEHFGKKTYLVGGAKLNGWMWTPPGQTLNAGDKLYITEGIFDAIALYHAHKKVAAIMGVSNKPQEFIDNHAHLNLHYIIALDNDEAGQKFAPRLVAWLKGQDEKVSCILPANDTKKCDWNDLWIAGKLKPADFDDYDYWGALLVVTNPKEKALQIVGRECTNNFPMEFGNRVYWVKYKSPKDDAKEEQDEDKKEEKRKADVVELTQISNCHPQYLYYQRDVETRESVYYIRITRPGTNRKYQDIMSPSAISAPGEFDKRLLGIGPGLMWTGGADQLKRYQQKYWFPTAALNEVDSVSFIGYAKEFQTYLFKDYAIHGGKLLKANEYDYFDLDNGKQVKTSMRNDPIHLSENHAPALWLKDFQTAYGIKGMLTITAWFGSLFAEQIRGVSASYPWVELSGKPGTGKTSILKFLWKLTGRPNYQGVELSKASHAGRWRSLEQSANLPIVLMEGDAGQGGNGGNQKKGFSLEEAKGTYEGDGMRITAQKTLGNETREPKFRGALWLAQNAQIKPPVDADPDSGKALMERIVHVHWDKSHFSTAGGEASERLMDLDMSTINGFLVHCVRHEGVVMDAIRTKHRAWVSKLKTEYPHLLNDRIRYNHAQMLALAEIMVEIGAVPLSRRDLVELQAYIIERAHARQTTIEVDHPIVEEFWELYGHLATTGGGEPDINMSNDDTRICVNLNAIEMVAVHRNCRMPCKIELRKQLETSKRHRFVEYKTVRQGAITRKCFVFERKE